MLSGLGVGSLAELIESTVPSSIRLRRDLNLPNSRPEHETLGELRQIGSKNKVLRSYIGAGYSGCITPPVIQRNILENPGWYTAYTPYQAEIAQGRLEALLNFQTMITDLTGLQIANASLLDEGTAAAEAMSMCHALRGNAAADVFMVSSGCHPQTISVVQTRAKPLGLKVVVSDPETFALDASVFAVLLQYPNTDGGIVDYSDFIADAHRNKALVIMAADLLALTLLRPPGELGADVAVGSTQRFGVPFGFGGPHAAYFATRDAHKRHMPGRLVGVSRDAQGRPAYRLSLQTREQHIRRDKATSNICTAQVLLAVMASMYAVYHGPEGLRAIALRIRKFALQLAHSLTNGGYQVAEGAFFDTVRVSVPGRASALAAQAQQHGFNIRVIDADTLCLALDETTPDIGELCRLFDVAPLECNQQPSFSAPLGRSSAFLTHPVFNRHHTETEMLRYLRRLEARDLSLTTSMIPLGSCTMKLNATSEMMPVTWPEFSSLHPFAPKDQTLGYQTLFQQLEAWLAEITGFAGVSLQPNAGSQGEYAGLLAIRDYHLSRNQPERTVCLIPQSAHGTNPASAVMAGFKVVPVACKENGDIDLEDLKSKAQTHSTQLAALMVTYPSTHGVFEENIVQVCELIHAQGGQVYMDGANMNAQVGLCRPADFGADVCHLNLHKTFCIPHGGGGPGVGPIGVAAHLVPFLPPTDRGVGSVSAAPWGSASILLISWAYIRMMGATGLRAATELAILNANYIAARLEPFFPVLYKGKNNRVAHECILDLRQFSKVTAEDVAKRLMDYGFHAPTLSWPVAGTLMVEPTESESKQELDRFCDAMIAIHAEIMAVENGVADATNNPLKNAPHTAQVVAADMWERPYSREQAAYPAPWTREHKFWPYVGRIDNVHGDRNLVCTCLPVEAYA